VTKHDGRRIERVLALFSRERAQTNPDHTVMLSVISGSSILAVAKVSSAATVLTGLMPLTAVSGLARLVF